MKRLSAAPWPPLPKAPHDQGFFFGETLGVKWGRLHRAGPSIMLAMSNGVVVVPSSLKPWAWMLSWFRPTIGKSMNEIGIAKMTGRSC